MKNTTRQPWIVCAALKFNDGTIVTGPRHYDKTMHATIRDMKKEPEGVAQQGFIDQWGNFYGRVQALQIARDNKQCYRNPDAVGELFSEDLY